MNILITGGAGFIGSHLTEKLIKSGNHVTVFDDFSAGNRENLAGMDVHVVEASILDQDALEDALSGVDLVYHLAAYTSAPGSLDEPLDCVNLNNMGLLNVMKKMQKMECKRIIFASSAAVYGNEPTLPKVETMTACPESIYALSKADGENYLTLLAKIWGLESVALRFFNVFGPRQNPDSGYAAAIPNFCKKASLGEKIIIHGDGEQTRDFVFVEDLVEALAHVGQAAVDGEIFNVGYGESVTINDLVGEILILGKSNSELEYSPVRAGDVRHSLADSSKLKASGWVPQVGFSEGLQRTVDFYIKAT